MKFFIVSALFVSFQALACPILEGSFSYCRSTHGVLSNLRELTISQSDTDGIISYTLNAVDEESARRTSQTIHADGKSTSHIDHEGITETTRTYCEGNALIQEIIFSKAGLILGTGQKVMLRLGSGFSSTIVGKLGGQLITDQLICE